MIRNTWPYQRLAVPAKSRCMNCSCTTSGLLILESWKDMSWYEKSLYSDSSSHLCLFWPSMDRGGAHQEGSGVIKAQLKASNAFSFIFRKKQNFYMLVMSDTTRYLIPYLSCMYLLVVVDVYWALLRDENTREIVYYHFGSLQRRHM